MVLIFRFILLFLVTEYLVCSDWSAHTHLSQLTNNNNNNNRAAVLNQFSLASSSASRYKLCRCVT